MLRHRRNGGYQDDGSAGEAMGEVQQQGKPALPRPSRPGNASDREGGKGDREPFHLTPQPFERSLPAHQTGREDAGAADNRDAPPLVPLRLDR